MFSIILCVLCLISRFSFGMALTPRSGGSNPLPPLPPAPPVPPLGPDNYPIPGTDLKLKVSRPYGEVLPHNPTLFCLVNAQAALEANRTAQGNIEMPLEWPFQAHGINLLVLRISREDFHISEAIALLRNLVVVMTQYPELGTRAVGANLWEPASMFIGRVEVSRGAMSGVGASLAALNTSMLSSNISPESTNLTVIDPKNYRVPGSSVTVALTTEPPYLSRLPYLNVGQFLTSAIETIRQEIAEYGDITMGFLIWKFEASMLDLEIPINGSAACFYSDIWYGVAGMREILLDPDIGAIAGDFKIYVDEKGEVATGKLRQMDKPAVENAGSKVGNATVIEQGQTATKTLGGAVVETGAVATS